MPHPLTPIIHPIIVAAGVGKRFGSEQPKQYTCIHNKTVLQHSVSALQQTAALGLENGVTLTDCCIVISAEDTMAKSLELEGNIQWVTGGAERMNSVFNGVDAVIQNLVSHLQSPDMHWVLIHDAARPCVEPSDIINLIKQTITHSIGQTAGGLLAVPVRDTVKSIEYHANQVVSKKTIDRSRLWLAQTPQLFPLATLHKYLTQAITHQIAFTDEASLFEHFGHTPLLVEGRHSNIKLTFPEDKLIAEALLQV